MSTKKIGCKTAETKKKANGEGSITQRKDGRWMARYHYKGKRNTIYGKTKTEVRRSLQKVLADIDDEQHIAPEKITLQVWMEQWLADYIMPTVKQATYVSYCGHVYNHILPELGHVALQKLDLDMLQHFFSQKAVEQLGDIKLISPKTIKNIYNTFRLSLEQAVMAKKIKVNPISGVKICKQEEKEMRVFDCDEQNAILLAARLAPELHAFGIIFALSTGVRIGELLGLKWQDVDMQKHAVHIKRTVQRLPVIDPKKLEQGLKTEIVIDTPKTKRSRRDIPLFDSLWQDLMEYKQKQEMLKISHEGLYEDEDFIFCNPIGRVIEPRTYSDLFQRVCKQANVQDASFHATRHTFATRALENGMDILVLSALLGHAQSSTTLNKYGHALPNHKADSMNKMENLYNTMPEEALERDEQLDIVEQNSCQFIFFDPQRRKKNSV